MEEYLKSINNLRFRKEKMMEQAKRIETMLSGRYIHYYELMEDENGVYSEAKTWKMVEELLDALKRYDKFYASYDEDEEDFDIDELEDYFFSELQEAFYRSFLYCVLRWGYSGIGNVDGKGSFEDFIQMADSIGKIEKYEIEDLLFDEKYDVTWEPFFTWNDLYSSVTGRNVSDTAKEEDILTMREKYATRVQEVEERWKQEEQKTIAAYGGEMSLEEIREQEERIMIECADDLWKDVYEIEQRAIENFQEKDTFAKQYLIFRETFFKVDYWLKRRMKANIEGMLDIYLYEKGFSKFLEDDLFFQTYAMIRKTANYVEGYMPERVR